mmetsp:Transcript_71531/g.205215  ORF Transcript_71531/g.205215 Transcript_71531/m.205215 type:complete len:597 (+) Transcript_71531:170-1960(+)
MASVDLDLQVSGMGTRPASEWPKAIREGVAALRSSCGHDPEFRRHGAFGVLEDVDLVRVLLARQGDVEKAVAMLKRALAWRSRRMPYWLLVDPTSDFGKVFEVEFRAGKIQAAGHDRYGRGLLILDNGCENTKDDDTHMRLLAYSVEAARRSCLPGVDKICVAMNLEHFSVRNSVPRRVLMETIEILTIVYPETLGTCILWQAPSYALAMLALAKPFLDPRTLQKFAFVSGDASPGSEADRQMVEVVGPDWRVLTGLGLPPKERCYSEYFRREIACARGFEFEPYWKRRQRDDAARAKEAGGPPWRHLPRDSAIDPALWDGAYPGYWASSLPSRHRAVGSKAEAEAEFADTTSYTSEAAEAEVWASPRQSDSDGAFDGTPAPQKLGRSATPLSIPRRIVGGLASIASASSTPSNLSGHGRPPGSGSSTLRVLGGAALLLSALLALDTTFAISLQESADDGGTTPSRGAVNLLAAFRLLTLLDIPLVSVGLGLLMHGDSVPGGCECLPPNRRCLNVPGALLLLRFFSMPEAIRTVARVTRHDLGDAAGSPPLPLVLVYLQSADALLSVTFALLWVWRLSNQVGRYARLPSDSDFCSP